MNILVTGHQGFVGRHLVPSLESQGHTVYGLDIKDGGEFDVRLDVLFAKQNNETVPLSDKKIDMVIHLAANCSNPVSMKNPSLDFTTNALGTLKVLEYCKKDKIPILFFSTCRVYADGYREAMNGPGEYQINYGYDGNEPHLRPPYGLSKLTAENYIILYNTLFEVPYIILRPSTIYGPGQDGTEEAGWIYHFINKAIEKEPITVFGDGEQGRDVLYIDDLIALVMEMVGDFKKFNKDFYGSSINIYNVGGGFDNYVTLNDVCAFLDVTPEYDKPRSPDFKIYCSNMEKLFQQTKWRPTTKWLTGINKIKKEIENGKD